MQAKVKVPAGDPQFFFSDNFLIQLNMDHQGAIDGWVVHYPIGLNLAESFRGISFEENGLMKFSFFIEWRNPNLNGTVLTAYSGEIFKTNKQETRLALEWLQVKGDPLSLCIPSYKGSEVLRELSENDPVSQARRRAFLDRLDESPKRQ